MTEKEKKAKEEKVFRELWGLKTGQYMANKNAPSMAHYPYEIILLTFKYVKQHELDSILQSKKFNDDKHKFNYILKIIDSNINTVYNKIKKIKEEQNRVDNIEVVELPNYNNQYEKKNINKNFEKFC